MKPPRTPTVGLLAIGITVALMIGFGVTPPAGALPTRSPSSGSNLGAWELNSAEGSLKAGGGPAGGASLSCMSEGTLSARCGSISNTALTYPTGATWSNLTILQGTNPGGYVEGGMTWDASDGYVLLWGGGIGSGTEAYAQNVTWSYLNGVWHNLTAEVTGGHPAGNLLFGLAYDPSTGVVVQFGGTNSADDALVNSTWTYHNLAWTNITSTAGRAPSARSFVAFSEDTTDDEAVLVGGETSESFQSDTWTFHDGTWTNVTATAGNLGSPVVYPASSNDPAEHGVLLSFVTNGTPKLLEATWVFAGGTWTNITATAGAPPLAVLGSMAWSAQTSSVVYSSGLQLSPLTGTELISSTTWAFYQGAWVNLTSTVSPALSSTFAAVSSSSDGSVLVFGGIQIGITESFTDYMYGFALPPSVSGVVAAPATIDAGMSTNFTATATGGIAPVALNYTFGDGTNHSGSTTVEHAYSAAGSYSVQFSVRDLTGRSANSSTTVTVNPDLAVSAVAASGTNVTTGTSVSLSVTATGGTNPLLYAWTFGDGATSILASPSHTWNSSGTYTVTVVVTDAAGAHQTKTVSIYVSSPSPNAFSLTSGTGLYLLIVIVIVVVAVAALLAMRMRRKPSGSTPGAPPAWTPPTGSPAPGQVAPPAPPGSAPPPGAGGPPPGAL
jgi:PKD repeat protein